MSKEMAFATLLLILSIWSMDCATNATTASTLVQSSLTTSLSTTDNSNNSISSSSPGTASSATTTSSTATTTAEQASQICLKSGVAYKLGTCYCQLDPCLDAIFSSVSDETLCPPCAVAPQTDSTAAVDWQTLFTSDPPGASDKQSNVTATTSVTTARITTHSKLPTDASPAVPISSPRCNSDLSFGVQLTSDSQGERCCCPSSFSGEQVEVTVLAVTAFDDPSYGISWEDDFADPNFPETRAVLNRVGNELRLLAEKALGNDMTNYTFWGVELFPPASLQANLTVTLRQSRANNALTVSQSLAQIIEAYNDTVAVGEDEEGVFGQTFDGYQRTSYDPSSVTSWRILVGNASSVGPPAQLVDGGNDKGNGIGWHVVIVFLGAAILIAMLGYMFFAGGGRICFCRAWYS